MSNIAVVSSNYLTTKVRHKDPLCRVPSFLQEGAASDHPFSPEFSPYMILSFNSTKRADGIAATMHPYDRICRPQIVKKEWER